MTHFRARMCYFKVWKLIFIILTPYLPTNRHLTILMTNLTEREVYLRNRFTVVRFNSKLSIIWKIEETGFQVNPLSSIHVIRRYANYAIKRAVQYLSCNSSNIDHICYAGASFDSEDGHVTKDQNYTNPRRRTDATSKIGFWLSPYCPIKPNAKRVGMIVQDY